MRISDVFVMGGGGYGYGGYGYGSGDYGFDCYRTDHYCLRSYDSPDKYNDPRSYRQGLAHIIGSRKNCGSGLAALFIQH